ncbi:hypothetical protein GCM10009682_33910 [Luedemannella flava]|uniref:LPXTG cell wall anchor domain-containing protein n=1 Tax=Luedemannella flava TaxID=349316 RepID=A0ABP4YBP4_9ACTN
MRTSLVRAFARLGLALAVGCATLIAAAPAVQAAEKSWISVRVHGKDVVQGTAYKPFTGQIHSIGSDTHGVVLKIDARKLDPKVIDFALPTSVLGNACTTVTTGVVTCPIGTVPDGDRLSFIALAVNATHKVGPAGSFTLSLTATDELLNPAVFTQQVSVVPSTYDLGAVAADVVGPDGGPIAPGGTGELRFALYNTGDTAIKGIRLWASVERYVTFVDEIPGCTYQSSQFGNYIIWCEDPEVELGPDEAIELAEPLKVKVSTSARGPHVYQGRVGGAALIDTTRYAAGAPSKRAAFTVRPATATQQALVDGDNLDNEAAFDVHVGRNTSDFAVTASGPASGAVGQKVLVTFTLTNKGPAEDYVNFTITAPAGTVIVDGGPGPRPYCMPENPDDMQEPYDPWGETGKLFCSLDDIAPVGRTFTVKVAFKIKKAGTGEGSIIVKGYADPNAANDTATFAITGTKGTSAPASTAKPTAPATTGSAGGDLPTTGSSLTLLITGGVLLLVAGAALLVIGRVRRSRTTA